MTFLAIDISKRARIGHCYRHRTLYKFAMAAGYVWFLRHPL